MSAAGSRQVADAVGGSVADQVAELANLYQHMELDMQELERGK